jgi:hypothetical protein
MPLRLAEPAAFSVGKGDTAIRRMGETAMGQGGKRILPRSGYTE